ncbi:MAG: tetratricopeptide repeat protein, partial [Planctomycetaceae bacterium]|nr:tetratricopeptide repeat protein [Planctomycetaceae bacterium]
KAFKDYTEAIRLDPTFALAYNNRGVIHNSIGDQDQAIADYSMAIELDPTLAIAYYNRGSTYESAGYDSASAEMDLAYARELGYKP